MKPNSINARAENLRAQCFAESSVSDEVWALFDELRALVGEYLKTRDGAAYAELEDFSEGK